MAVLVISRAANIGIGEFNPGRTQRLKHPHRLSRYFGANAVSGQYRNLHRFPALKVSPAARAAWCARP